MSVATSDGLLPSLLVQPLPEGFDQLCSRLRPLGIETAADLRTRCESLTDGVALDRVLDLQPDPDLLARAWKAVLTSASTSRDNAALIATLGAFLIAFHRASHDTEVGLSRRGLGLARSRSEAALRLFGREYDAVRKLLRDRSLRGAAKTLIAEAVSTAGLVEIKLHTNDRARRNYFGMRGVARLVLARGRDSEAPVQEYQEALRDLEQARQLGDTSPEHYEYEIETLLRIQKHTGDEEALAGAERLLEECKPSTRGLLYCAADAAVRRGLALADGKHWGEARGAFLRAVDFASRGLTSQGGGTPEDVFYAKRAQANQRLFSVLREMDGSEDVAFLNAAISDAERVGPGSPIGGTTLGAALLLRAMAAKKGGQADEAIRDLQRAVASLPASADDSEPRDVRARAVGLLAELCLWKAIAEGAAADVERALEDLLQAPEEGEPSVAPVGPAIDRLTEQVGVEGCAHLIRSAADFIERSMRGTQRDAAARRFAASHAGNTLLWLLDAPDGSGSGAAVADLADLERAWRLLREAVEASPEPAQPELWGRRGEAALRLAKRSAREGVNDDDVRLLLEDACTSLAASLDAADRAAEGFRLTEGHSKLGEACVRLHAITLADEHAERAISALSRARDLGNTTPHLIGLLGDAYYRRGRARRDSTDLRRALELKAEARKAGHVSRENWSVSAAAALRAWRLTGDRADLRAAAEAICAAHEVDDRWPWPPLQMADLARLPDDVRRPALGDLASGLARAAYAGDLGSLEALGATLAVHSDEFERVSLGGRRRMTPDPVHVLDDPHGLLSDTMVLKPMKPDEAEQEMSTVREFGAYLRRVDAPRYLRLPDPMAIIPRAPDRKPVYVMRRAQGRKLSSIVIAARDGLGEPALPATRRALEFLAYYHAFGWSRSRGRDRVARSNIEAVAMNASRRWKELGRQDDAHERLSAALLELVRSPSAALLKKDAHAENWLVTQRGEVVMIDLEATSALPVLYEVAQLMEDYPLLPCDTGGDATRAELLSGYLQILSRHAPDAVQGLGDDPYGTYQVYSLFRCAACARFLHRHSDPIDSSSALRSAPLRAAHYSSLSRWLSHAGRSQEVRDAAALVSEFLAAVRAS